MASLEGYVYTIHHDVPMFRASGTYMFASLRSSARGVPLYWHKSREYRPAGSIPDSLILDWVGVKEFKLSYHNSDTRTLFADMYIPIMVT